MWLVLCDSSDASALWACQSLRLSGLQPVELCTSDSLALSDHWDHRIRDGRATICFRLPGGRMIEGDKLRGVLNRLYAVPIPHWRSASRSDQEYVQQELFAFHLSWLHGLSCPVINRPTPQGLCGRWRHESEWVWLAGKAGLPVATYRQSAHDRIAGAKGERRLVAPGMTVKTVIVVGDRAAGAPAPPPIMEACTRLARLAETDLLGIDLVDGAAGPWTFAGASPAPDLALGGTMLIRAIVCRFAAERAIA
jgi:hypothetical protein